jgi:CheY-like chemotaxis protein
MASKILLIEDSATFRALLTAALRQKGYTVVGAPTGLAGIQAAKYQNPNAISLDLSLPDISGLEVLSALKADLITRHIPVIICTACVDGGLKEEALQRGAVETLTKPLQSADLFAALKRQLSPVDANGDLTYPLQLAPAFKRVTSPDYSLDRGREASVSKRGQ